MLCACICVESLQLCQTLYEALGSTLPGSSVHGTLQARILEWVAMTSSRGSSWPRDQTHISISPALAGRFFTTSTTGGALVLCSYVKIWHKYCLELYLEPEEGLNLALIFILANMFFSWQSIHWRIRASTSALMVRRQMLSFLPLATCKVYLSQALGRYYWDPDYRSKNLSSHQKK